MDLMEYQAKELFAKHDVPVTLGTVITDPAEAAAARRGERRPGGRQGPGQDRWPRQGRWREARHRPRRTRVAKAEEILGMDIKGHTVHRVLVAPAADIAEEYYFSFLVDRANRNYLCIASIEGGVEIEVIAVENPDAVAKVADRPAGRRRRRQGAPRSSAATGFPADVADAGRTTIVRSCGTSSSRRTPRWSRSTRWSGSADGRLEALDGKVSLDANADFRHAEPRRVRGPRRRRTRSRLTAKEKGLNYVKLDGDRRHHRQRRRPGDVHPRRGRLRR